MIQAIRVIQAQLKVDGFYKYTLDGLYGNNTDTGIKEAIKSGKYKLDFNFDLYKILFKQPRLNQGFVDSINTLFKTFNSYSIEGGANPLYVAYMLATAHLETAYTMQPIKEYGGDKYLSKYDTGRLAKILGNTPEADGDGQFYAGRGYVQITGKDNYIKFSNILDIDLVQFPDLALDYSVAAKILVIGSLRGSFTSRSLKNYIRTGSRLDFIRARAVINGNNEAAKIADYALSFVKCITLVRV